MIKESTYVGLLNGEMFLYDSSSICRLITVSATPLSYPAFAKYSVLDVVEVTYCIQTDLVLMGQPIIMHGALTKTESLIQPLYIIKISPY
jgi:hypothetical protein